MTHFPQKNCSFFVFGTSRTVLLLVFSWLVAIVRVGVTVPWQERIDWNTLAQARQGQKVVRAAEWAWLDPLWAGGIWAFPGWSCRVLTEMETVALTKGKAMSSLTAAAERSTRWLWLKGRPVVNSCWNTSWGLQALFAPDITLFLLNPCFIYPFFVVALYG